MPLIDVGPGAIDRSSYEGYGYTLIDIDNPANETGHITSVELWFNTNATGVKVGVFYGSGASYTCRAYATIGNVTAGSKQTFAVDIAVQAGDFLGVYFATGQIEQGTGANYGYYKFGDQTGSGTKTYSSAASYAFSVYATGLGKPEAPTNVAATDGTYADKVVVTWTKSAEATGYRVYRDDVDVSGLLGDVATYNDSGAGAPDIGKAVATNGTYPDKVSLSLDGTLADGTTHTYKVTAVNGYGEGPASGTNTGYRSLGGSPTFQWQRSASVNAASFSNITGATADEYDDTVPRPMAAGAGIAASSPDIA